MKREHSGGQVIRAVVFDLDDTLFLERQYVRSGYKAVDDFLNRKLRRGPARQQYAAWMWRRFQAGQRENMFDALNERFELNLSRREVLELVKVYREHRPEIQPVAGVVNLLRRLREAGLKIGLLTDGFLPAQRLKFAALGLEEFFTAAVFTEDLGRSSWKPSPRGFRLIAKQLGIRAHECAYVGDNPAKDFLAPNKLGWLSVQWLRRGQLQSANPTPPGGKARQVVHFSRDLIEALTSARSRRARS